MGEHLDHDRIVQEVQRLNNECHNREYNEDVTETKYWSESYILTNRPTTTSFRQHNPFLHDAWCKKKKHKIDKRNEILSMTHYNRLLHDAWFKKRRHKKKQNDKKVDNRLRTGCWCENSVL